MSAYHIRRWDSECLTLAGIDGANALGKVLALKSRLERWRPLPKGGWRELRRAGGGGGLLYDIGSHLIDQALYLFGPVAEVYAELDQRRRAVESDDDVFVALTHRNGVRSHLWTSVMAAQPGPRLRVMGDRARFREAIGRRSGGGLARGRTPGLARLGRGAAGTLGRSQRWRD